VATSVFLVAVVIVCYLLGKPTFFALAAAAILLSLFELLHAVRAGTSPATVFALASCFGMLLAAYLRRTDWFLAVAALVPAGCLLLALPGRAATTVEEAAWTVLGVAWIGGGGAAAVLVLAEPWGGLRILIAFLVVAAAEDIAAYFVGTSLGRHHMVPRISPAKTWEGLAGGVAGALLVAAVLVPLATALDLLQALGLGAIVAVLAPLGDLVESKVKRELDVKDSGTLLPGHGGMLDRLDAILFCAPAVLLYLRSILS
jgi:phosphatidate cytidylyltransferase